jgi:DNA-directed RNA polymerase II subunit RPB4
LPPGSLPAVSAQTLIVDVSPIPLTMEEEMRDAPREMPQPPTFRAPKSISRPKPPVQQEEELGAEPKLGDFEDVHALSVSEARAVITAVHAARKKKDPASNPLGGDRVHNDSQTINQFIEYLENFSRFKQNENLHALSGLLDSHSEISSVEKAMLGTCSSLLLPV